MKSKIAIVVSIIVISVMSINCGKSDSKEEIKSSGQNTPEKEIVSTANYKIEFVELGSVNCIPCKKMQPIMASIEKKYGGQVKVTFYDVWKDPAPGQKFGIQLIPTQVFLDDKGVELMRHEGFFPEEEIDKFLQSKGLVISN